MAFKCNFYFDDQTGLLNSEVSVMLNELCEHIGKYLKLHGEFNLSASVVDLDTIHEINKKYRSIDRPTDVISFAYEDVEEKNELGFRDLGDILISLDVLKKQAKEFNHKDERELSFLFIHGFLHLLGYDHVKDEKEAEEMYRIQNEILNSFNYDFKDLWGELCSI